MSHLTRLPTQPPAPVAALVALLREVPPSCGPVRLVAVDGHAGSGKTTFAGRLAVALGGAPVLHLDALASHDAFFDWTGRLTEAVLSPLSHGRSARYRVYDWARGEFPADPAAESVLDPEPVVVVEGVGAGRRALRPYLACLLWMDMSPAQAWRRGRKRDGPELTEFWRAWTRAERTHFAEDPSSSYANFVVRQGVQGYEVRRGPEGHR
ncbi:MAG: uridine kinase family protein [Streptomyces sp.]|uniref:uridine kinase family protein n=1 Tax=Streptomyces sp. TaxID=1931 RepID=UPI003D6B543F